MAYTMKASIIVTLTVNGKQYLQECESQSLGRYVTFVIVYRRILEHIGSVDKRPPKLQNERRDRGYPDNSEGILGFCGKYQATSILLVLERHAQHER